MPEYYDRVHAVHCELGVDGYSCRIDHEDIKARRNVASEEIEDVSDIDIRDPALATLSDETIGQDELKFGMGSEGEDVTCAVTGRGKIVCRRGDKDPLGDRY